MAVKLFERVQRSLAKSITFRILIIIADIFIIFAITHRYDETILVILLTNLASSIIYFLHERVWNKIRWGTS